MTITFGSLFAGIGGFDLGLERAGMQCKWMVEIDEFCQKVLTKHWPDVPKYRDIKECGDNLEPVDLVCGGFPCQPFSTSKHGVQSRHEDLSGELIRVIRETGPKYAIVENVSKKPIIWCSAQLQSFGYHTDVGCISAVSCGAWHQRDRWFVIAYPNNQSEFQSPLNAEMALLSRMGDYVWTPANYARALRVHDGVPSRVDRLKSLGNAVVPQVAEFIGRRIVEFDQMQEIP